MVGHLGQRRAPRHRPGPEFAPEPPARSALGQGAGPTHLHEIKAGQEGHAVLDHFALWPLLRRHPGRLPESASSPGRGVHRAAEASCLLQPQAPGAADVTFPAGTARASALHAAPPPLPAPLCSNPGRSPSSPYPGPPLPVLLHRETSSSLLQAVAAMASPSLPPSLCSPPPFPGSALSELDVKNRRRGDAPLDIAAVRLRS